MPLFSSVLWFDFDCLDELFDWALHYIFLIDHDSSSTGGLFGDAASKRESSSDQEGKHSKLIEQSHRTLLAKIF